METQQEMGLASFLFDAQPLTPFILHAMHHVVALVGPTAVGKSACGVRLAHAYNGEIISADSRQVYRGLNVGSGKIMPSRMHGVPHHLLDVTDCGTRYTAHDFSLAAQAAIAGIQSRGHLPCIVGGSGFYLEALLYRNTVAQTPPDYAFREWATKQSTATLQTQLRRHTLHETIDIQNRRKLIRALEILRAIGYLPKRNFISRYDHILIGLTRPREALQERIRARLTTRWEALLRETHALLQNGVCHMWLESLGLEYRFMARHLQGTLSEQETYVQLLRAICAYAKRQETWWRRYTDIAWFSPDAYSDIAAYLHTALRERAMVGGPTRT